MYQHLNNLDLPIELPAGKVVCVGRNYLDHVQEMRSEVPDEALLFMKPKAALCHLQQPIVIPGDKGECHNELELAVLIKKPLKNASEEEALQAIWGVGIALDLTLREVQTRLKGAGHPWERAKAFDGSCPVSGFVPRTQFEDLQNLEFSLTVNQKIRQQGNTAAMMRPVLALLAEMSAEFSLEPGDIVLTGTPKGVGPLAHGDTITARLSSVIDLTTSVVAA
ncbi:fumarylacetoacetate hydrolase family protein [Salinimonas marina]|uniref:Fumarylacetoacetate hydrolase family protein n=1 Tax=Salinimonas marina TaxID=2785918 RepID=A0A7S9E090_9ALTE|nr:fumarylacetoacetate hydrolase family protein [Salinimonas marina]QPG06655.1 fumarylacetoacetate hydrolase family protein [Salinimonas marina]